jgi:hypothetical protein
VPQTYTTNHTQNTAFLHQRHHQDNINHVPNQSPVLVTRPNRDYAFDVGKWFKKPNFYGVEIGEIRIGLICPEFVSTITCLTHLARFRMLLANMASVIVLAFLILLQSFIGIEMVNTPPTKKWHKWFWRISFFTIGFCTIVIYCQQYRGEEEKSKQTYDNFVNVLSNEAVIKQSVEDGKDVMKKAVGVPEFKLYFNDVLITNGEIFSLQKSRRIMIRLMNISEITADQVSVELDTPMAFTESNVIANGWVLEPQPTSISGDKISDTPVGNNWRWQCDQSIAGFQGWNCAALEISTNFEYPVSQVAFTVYANRSKPQRFLIYLTF